MADWSKYQQAIFADFEADEGNLVVEAVAGSGKCLGRGTPVLRFDGQVVPVEEIRPGDLLMGPDSRPRRVHTTSRGNGPLYRVTPIKGDPWICNDVHVLTLKGTNRKMGQTIDISLADILRQSEGRRFDRDWKLFRVPVSFHDQVHLEVEPYLVGLWIGDGTRGEAQLTNSDPEIIGYCAEAAERYGSELVLRWAERDNTFNLRFRVGERGEAGRHTPHILRRFFRQRCCEDDRKTIPPEYLIASTEDRLSLLAGIIDTDGYWASGGYDLVTKWPELADQMLFLARSLGFAAYSSEKVVELDDFVGTYSRISLSGDLERIPCKVGRKKAKPRQQIKRHLVTGFEVEPIDDGEFFGFTLTHDGRFLLGDFTVTHNTTTIIEGVARVPDGQRIVVCAFNKSIERELSNRVPRNVQARTLHGLGFYMVKRAFGFDVDVDEHKGKKIAEGILIEAGKSFKTRSGETKAIGAAKVAKLAGLAKNLLTPPDDVHGLAEVAIDYDVHDAKVGSLSLAELVGFAGEVMDASAEDTSVIDFDDMIWFPYRHGLKSSYFDVVVVDERQDLNACQVDLVSRLVSRNGRTVAVGDNFQAIYGFRGAGTVTMPRMIRELEAKTLPLSISYRCPKSVADHVKRFVPHFEAAPDAVDGEVRQTNGNDLVDNAKPGDFVLSRTNAPLVSLCLELLANGVPASVAGRDIGRNLIKLVQGTETENVTKMNYYVRDWADREAARMIKLEREKKAADVRDRARAIVAISQGARSSSDVIRKIEGLFRDGDPKSVVVFSSTHKAKGLERDRVWMLEDTYSPDGDQEERNLYYVAATRTRRELALVQGVK